MSKQRHLQGEIDRTLKQVEEGNDLFLLNLKKFQQAPPGSQKDKFEKEMGREIKKLQRHRDNIRAWVSSADVKDKNVLLEAKRKIEQQMEAFKACEKETKTKAYSREGLSSSGKIDPAEEEKAAMREWIQDTQRQFMDQINCIEAELESTCSSRRSRDTEIIEHLQGSIDRLQYHYDTLDLLLRKFENEGCVNAEKFQELKEVVEDFIAADFRNENEGAFQQVYEDLDILKSGSLLGSTGSVEDDSNSVHSDSVASAVSKKVVSKKPAADAGKRPAVLAPTKPEMRSDERQGRELKTATPSVWDFPSLARSTSAPVSDKQVKDPPPVEKPPVVPIPEEVKPVVEKPNLGTLLAKVEAEKETILTEVQDMDAAQELIDTSFFYAIRPDDRARPTLIVLNTPFPCHPSFPKCPLFREAERIKQVDLDTLFFIFYHQPGTYQQYLAANYLQKRNWLYHRKEQTWFQREDSGRAKTPGKGTYFYFDYTASWSQRLRQDFVFEPQHLESAVTD